MSEIPLFHQQILDASLPVRERHDLVFAGDHAMRAHGLIARPPGEIRLATVSVTALEEITADLAVAFERAGLGVERRQDTPRLARLGVRDPVTEQICVIDLTKEPLQRPPVITDIGPVAALDDLAGMRVAALCGPAAPHDFIDVAAVSDQYGLPDLERLGALFEEGFSVQSLAFGLESGIALDDAPFARHGLTDAEIARVRAFILAWYDDLSQRMAEPSLDGESE